MAFIRCRLNGIIFFVMGAMPWAIEIRQLMRAEGAQEEHTNFLCKEDANHAMPLQTDKSLAPRRISMTCGDFVDAAYLFLHHWDTVGQFVVERAQPQLETKFNFNGVDDRSVTVETLLARGGAPLAARLHLKQHAFALRHAWVALNGLKGEEAKRQQDQLKKIHSQIVEDPDRELIEQGDEDAPKLVSRRKDLVKLIHDTLTSHTVHSMLEASRKCSVPQKGLDSDTRSLRQKSRIRPAGPLTRDSSILLSSPDGSVSEESSSKMPLLTLGTGYTDCYKDKYIIYDRLGGEEKAKLGDPGSCSRSGDLPKPGFYKNAVQLGYKAIDTAIIYGTEEQIGADLSGRQDIFVTTKTMSPAFRNMLGVTHGTDKIKEQLHDLRRDSVNVLYNHHDGNNPMEWKMLEDEIDKGHAKALGASGIGDALDHEDCVKSGRCRHHVTLIQTSLSPCDDYPGNLLTMDPSDAALLANATIVAHSMIWACHGEPVFANVAKRLGKTMAQLAIRSVLEYGIPVLAQTSNPKHLQENLDVFDFDVSSADLGQLALIPKVYGVDDDLFEL